MEKQRFNPFIFLYKLLVSLLDQLSDVLAGIFMWFYNLGCRVGGEHGLWGPAERGDVSRVRSLIEQVTGSIQSYFSDCANATAGGC